MMFRIVIAGFTMAAAAAAAAADTVTPTAESAESASMENAASNATFIPHDFEVPRLVQAPGFKLVPLGPDLVKIDFDAYMSSIEHLQETFTRSTTWPHADISDADALQDMLNEQFRFESRQSFAYAVLTPDGSRELGCVYINPSPVDGYDAEVRMWVTKAEFHGGFDAELYTWVTDWVQRDWTFEKVAYPGRMIDWDTWDAMVAEGNPQQPTSEG